MRQTFRIQFIALVRTARQCRLGLAGISVLYVCPIRALLNNLEPRLDNADRILNAALSQPTAVGVVVTVNNNASGTQARAEQSQGADGRIHLDIIVEEIEGRMSHRIGRGEGMAPVLEHRYGLNPAAGAYR